MMPSWMMAMHFNLQFTVDEHVQPKLVYFLLHKKNDMPLHTEITSSPDSPPPRVQKLVLKECRKWNLAWVGLNKVAPLEPDEMEFLLGFLKDHTRGISRTERYRSLGNSFQVDTVAYHLSVLKDMYPQGMNVLSLFSGIGGAEVALHRLGTRMKIVISVEKFEVNRTILRSWWDQM